MCATPIARIGLTPSAVFTPKLGLWSVMRTRNAGLSTTKYVAIESTKAGTTVDEAGLVARAAGAPQSYTRCNTECYTNYMV